LEFKYLEFALRPLEFGVALSKTPLSLPKGRREFDYLEFLFSPIILPYTLPDIHVRIVPVAADLPGLNCGLYGAAGLVHVLAVIELAIVHPFAHFGKVLCQFFPLNINDAKFPYAGRINYAATKRKIVHFGKSGGVQTLAAPSAYLAGP
jgi:hypothetical protein